MRFLIAFAIAAVSLVTRSAQDSTAHLGGAQPFLEVHAQTMRRDGGTGQSATGSNPVVVGHALRWFIHVGTENPGEMTLCGGGASETGTLEDWLKRASFVWQVDMVPTKYGNYRTTFDLTWARYHYDGGAKPAAEGKETLTLGEGQRYPIDLARGEPGTRNCAAESIVIDAGAGVKEEPALEDAILQYDLWLTDAAASERQTRHFVAMGRQGGTVDYSFASLRFAVPRLAANQIDYDLVTTVLGTLRGRVKPDGGATIAVETTRRDGLARRGDSQNGYGAGTGSKILEVGDGETVGIELPAPSGRSARPAFEGARLAPLNRSEPPKQADTVKDGNVIVDEGLFFQGHRTSLVLQVKRVR